MYTLIQWRVVLLSKEYVKKIKQNTVPWTSLFYLINIKECYILIKTCVMLLQNKYGWKLQFKFAKKTFAIRIMFLNEIA